jgi:hypothetical protein
LVINDFSRTGHRTFLVNERWVAGDEDRFGPILLAMEDATDRRV